MLGASVTLKFDGQPVWKSSEDSPEQLSLGVTAESGVAVTNEGGEGGTITAVLGYLSKG